LQEVSLAGCTLNRSAGEQETTFKFHRSTKLEPGATTTVWSSDQNQTHELPTNIVMKSQKWFSAPEMSTLLFSNDGTEMARLEQVRVQRSLAATRLGEVFVVSIKFYFGSNWTVRILINFPGC
jgi:lamin B